MKFLLKIGSMTNIIKNAATGYTVASALGVITEHTSTILLALISAATQIILRYLDKRKLHARRSKITRRKA